MIYYAVIYLKDKTIHLKPFTNKEDASECVEIIKKINKNFESGHVLKKNLDKPSYKEVGEHWL